jgi:hypothetical protein
MIHIIDRIKTRFHNDLVASPEAHGWVLNLYRGGERYPQRVCDYFQSEFAPNKELARALVAHAGDEDQHVMRFTHALQLRGQPVVEIEMGDVFNEVIREFTPGTFHIKEADDAPARRWKLANFLAHAHHLEKRVDHSFDYHIDACEAAGQEKIATIVGSIQRDEKRHVEYTREAVGDLLTRKEAEGVMRTHQMAEAKANLMFSQRQVRAFLRHYRAASPRRRRLLFRLCAYIMEGAGRLA